MPLRFVVVRNEGDEGGKLPGTDKLVVPVYKLPGTDKLVVHVYKMPG